jgi:hypothetical protein
MVQAFFRYIRFVPEDENRLNQVYWKFRIYNKREIECFDIFVSSEARVKTLFAVG